MFMKRLRLAAGAVCAALLLGLGAPALADDNYGYSSGSGDPLRPQKVSGTIVDVALGNPAFSTLVAALTAADLVTTLQGKGPFTVFAPTNDAFAKIPESVLLNLLANPALLKQVLLYHVAGGRQDLRYAYLPLPLKTVQGQRVFPLRSRSGLAINNSRVILRPIATDNGIIYVIDSVLQPQYR